MEKVRIAGKSVERLNIIGESAPRVDPAAFAAALGAEPCGDAHGHLDLISLGELGSQLIRQFRESGERSEREVRLSPNETAELAKIFAAIEAKTGKRPELTRIAGVILSVHMDSLNRPA